MKKTSFLTTGLLMLALVCFSGNLMAQQDVDDAMSDGRGAEDLVVGAYMGLFYNNGWVIDFLPEVGYRVKDWMILGGGLMVSYQSRYNVQSYNDDLKSTLFGPRVFAKFNMFGQVYAITEYQYNWFRGRYKDSAGNRQSLGYCSDYPNAPNCINKSESVLYLGGGYSTNFGKGFGIYSDFMIDVLFDRNHSPRIVPFIGRFGLFYGF